MNCWKNKNSPCKLSLHIGVWFKMEKSLKNKNIGEEEENISGLLLNHPFYDLYGIGQSFLHSKLVSRTMVLVITIFPTLSTSYKRNWQ